MDVYMAMNIDDLEDWAIRAGQAMQEIIDDAEHAEGESDNACCADLKALLEELDRIVAGVGHGTDSA
jgi:hypothetical protein